MRKGNEPSVIRDENHRLRRPIRLVWNGNERRPRAPIRLLVGFVLFLVLAGLGNQYRPTLRSSDGVVIETVNMLVRQLPNAVGLSLAVIIAALLVDRRRLTDLGLVLDRGWWRGFSGGTTLGAGITSLGVIGGLVGGYYRFNGLEASIGPLVWVSVAIGAAAFQLLFIVPEELFVRGYLITNITEGLDGLPSVPRSVAAGVGVVVSSILFYLTHAAAKGAVFGIMVGGLSVLLGIGYVLSGDLSVPIGIHFGVNIAGVIIGTNPQPASLLRMTASTSVDASTVLPVEVVVVRLLGTVLGLGVLCWWQHAATGRLRVAPEITRPMLRWRRNGTAPNE